MPRIWLWISMSALGCADQSPGSATDSPSTLILSLAPGVSSDFSIAQLEGVEVMLQTCEGAPVEWDVPDSVDLLSGEITLPGGEWCGVTMAFDGPLSLQGETLDNAVFEFLMDIETLELQATTPTELAGEVLIMEVSEPGWFTPANLGIEPSSTFRVDSTHPQHDVLCRKVQSLSSIYLDTNQDGEVGKSERESGPLFEGALSMPGPVFVAMSDGGSSMVSEDGETWENVQSHGADLRDAVRSHGLILAVGGDDQGQVLSSLEGDTWMDLEDAGGGLTGVASSGSTAVLVGLDGRVSSSTDLLDWTDLTNSDTKENIYDEHFYAVAYGGSGFIIVGEEGLKLWSTDGTTWTAEPGTINLYDVAWGEDIFIAVGEGGARKQADGNGDWATPVFGGEDLTGVAYGEGRWVAVGPGRSVISDDGLSWEIFPQEFDLERVAYSAEIYLAIADGELYSSPDGIRWTLADSGQDMPIHWIRGLL